jgi:hypothetical protein
MKDKTIAVWFSCGAASAVAAKLTIEKYGASNSVLVINNPVDEERPDNRRFLKDVEKWIGQEIRIAYNKDINHSSAAKIWESRKYMSNRKGAPCTMLLKKTVRYQIEKEILIDYHVLGFTKDELERHQRFVTYERNNVIPVLIENNISKGRCFEILNEAGIKLPDSYTLGFANANCEGCVKATSPTYWNLLRATNLAVFNQRAEQSRKLKARLVRYKGKRIFLDELPVDAKGGKLKSLECGIFCDTK